LLSFPHCGDRDLGTPDPETVSTPDSSPPKGYSTVDTARNTPRSDIPDPCSGHLFDFFGKTMENRRQHLEQSIL
jgi:hypothetical protein